MFYYMFHFDSLSAVLLIRPDACMCVFTPAGMYKSTPVVLYIFTLALILGNTRTYSFTLKFQMNAWAITLIALGLTSAVAVVSTIVIKRKRTFRK